MPYRITTHTQYGIPNIENTPELHTAHCLRGTLQALFNMGYLHQMGKGLPQDLFMAKRYFDEAAEASTDAM